MVLRDISVFHRKIVRKYATRFISDVYESSEEIPVLEYFWKNSRSIEIMKDGELQKIHFRVKDEVSNWIWTIMIVIEVKESSILGFVFIIFLVIQGVLREEVKEMVKWNVDRSSSSTKIRELMDWSKDIVEDIYYQLEVRKNILADFLIKHW